MPLFIGWLFLSVALFIFGVCFPFQLSIVIEKKRSAPGCHNAYYLTGNLKLQGCGWRQPLREKRPVFCLPSVIFVCKRLQFDSRGVIWRINSDSKVTSPVWSNHIWLSIRLKKISDSCLFDFFCLVHWMWEHVMPLKPFYSHSKTVGKKQLHLSVFTHTHTHLVTNPGCPSHLHPLLFLPSPSFTLTLRLLPLSVLPKLLST